MRDFRERKGCCGHVTVLLPCKLQEEAGSSLCNSATSSSTWPMLID